MSENSKKKLWTFKDSFRATHGPSKRIQDSLMMWGNPKSWWYTPPNFQARSSHGPVTTPEAKACHPSLLQHVTALRLQPFQLLPGSSSPGRFRQFRASRLRWRFLGDPPIACKSAAMESTGAVPPSSDLLFLSKKFGGDNVWSSNVKWSLIERGVKVLPILWKIVVSTCQLGCLVSASPRALLEPAPWTESTGCSQHSKTLRIKNAQSVPLVCCTFMHHGCLQFCALTA